MSSFPRLNPRSRPLGEDIVVLAPLIDLPKASVIRLAHERGLTETYSCHAGQDVPCGVCIACLEILNSIDYDTQEA